MGKLHELLAVEPDLKGKAQGALSQVKALFLDGKGRLVGQVRSYRPLEENGEKFADENTELSTTVTAQLGQFSETYGAWIDAAVQKEVTNQVTGADVTVDGRVLVPCLPAPALLNLEGKLAEIRQVYAAIPTNDPSERWERDEQSGRWISKPRETYRTKKVLRNHVKAEATKEHPAQVDVYAEDVRVGTWTTTIHSGMLTPVEKQRRLDRVDILLRAVKEARQRANDIEVKHAGVARTLFDYINAE